MADHSKIYIDGALVQVLDPAEQEFPYGGRGIFRSMAGPTTNGPMPTASSLKRSCAVSVAIT